jgi:hypothetical protein
VFFDGPWQRHHRSCSRTATTDTHPPPLGTLLLRHHAAPYHPGHLSHVHPQGQPPQRIQLHAASHATAAGLQPVGTTSHLATGQHTLARLPLQAGIRAHAPPAPSTSLPRVTIVSLRIPPQPLCHLEGWHGHLPIHQHLRSGNPPPLYTRLYASAEPIRILRLLQGSRHPCSRSTLFIHHQ